MDIWEKMQAKLDDQGHKWLGRQSAPAIADNIARMLTTTVELNAVTLRSETSEENHNTHVPDSKSAGDGDSDADALYRHSLKLSNLCSHLWSAKLLINAIIIKRLDALSNEKVDILVSLL